MILKVKQFIGLINKNISMPKFWTWHIMDSPFNENVSLRLTLNLNKHLILIQLTNWGGGSWYFSPKNINIQNENDVTG